MTMTNAMSSPDDFEPGTNPTHEPPAYTSHDTSTLDGKISTSGPDSTVFKTLAVCILIGLGALASTSQLNKVSQSILQDAEVQKTVQEASEKILREVVASWHRHGGTAALTGDFLRLSTLFR